MDPSEKWVNKLEDRWEERMEHTAQKDWKRGYVQDTKEERFMENKMRGVLYVIRVSVEERPGQRRYLKRTFP